MTPAARVAAAIEILDDILAGLVPEKALTGWGRSHRFAGSKDRAAIRDHVFGALRCRASYAWLGGAETGRGIMLGAMRSAGLVDEVFTAEGHAPEVVGADEVAGDLADAPRAVRLDLPEWLLPLFDEVLKAEADPILELLQSRAGVFLRVNVAKGDGAAAMALLAEDGIVCEPVINISNALQVIENERRVALSQAYEDGLVELQDTSSQVAISDLEITKGLRVLDYCAGGGGKALAMAALGAEVSAYDIDQARMQDITPRAQRAGVTIEVLSLEDLENAEPFDLVLCDAPCSGSGTWRRTPAAKWDLTAERLAELNDMQDDVLRSAAPLVAQGGSLAYATCSIFECENSERINGFLTASPEFSALSSRLITPHAKGDGFFLARLQRN
ncbi:RsmB/NOP family class I SAM-dependent RNA methyltransferase [Octadecabacter sp. 1_MG-2023]|uniref:RsmB/NOP family class I SAM-dependent RNA methyltransferase n=1 Tax=unclassified Octadecabacter TaxID=196158 RepID=UPI001C09791A|nr:MULTISPECIES: RsmB/NOP family class I SAM-dependent RNA methyltransferase [unclassified Octadecabacter]MBU2993382.1 RsmB/NOP family class I SAM-dependent RNA methyltransferase [Octadecabacter sp. B2R22]MDO6733162.1 RsmB/NOP family class I SAM-dependent RNA methyltransferase [Octadecabacter sp. 1_MG-2023]